MEKTFYLISSYLSSGIIETTPVQKSPDTNWLRVRWGNSVLDWKKVGKDSSFDRTEALVLAKELVERKLKSIEKQKKKLEQQKVELEKELEQNNG